ncbi:hypothetical protein Gpo141_00006946 [Globisporangium polare]
MTSASRKRTLTSSSTGHVSSSTSSSYSSNHLQHQQHQQLYQTDVDDANLSVKSGKSSTSQSGKSSSSRSGRSLPTAATTNLSVKEYHERCRKVAHARVEDMVRRHYKFRTEEGSHVDPSRWKLIKEKNHMTCYRKVGKSGVGQVPDVLATGGVPGALEDVLHGVVNLSTEAMQIENAYAAGDMVDSRILTTLVSPTVSDPFRSMTIKWVLRNHEELSRHRDYVFLESTGITTAPDGEKIGYHLVHSIALPSAPAFTKDSNIIRGQVSSCYVFRQHRQNGVEVFYTGNLNPQGSTRERQALTIAVESILASSSSVQCAMMKKLAYSLRTKAPREQSAPKVTSGRGRKNTITSFMRSASVPPEERSSACAVCRRNLRFFGKGSCELCAATACGRCRVTKKLFMFDHGVFNPVKMEFCTECVVSTNTMSSFWVATRELEMAGVHLDDSSDTSSSIHSSNGRRGRGYTTQGSSNNRLHKAHSVESEGSVDEDRYTMVTDYSSSSGYDRSSRIWLPSDRIMRPTTDILAAIRAEPEGEDAVGHSQQAFFAEEEDDGEEAFPIIDMPSDEECENEEDEDNGNAAGRRRANHAVDLLYLYNT